MMPFPSERAEVGRNAGRRATRTFRTTQIATWVDDPLIQTNVQWAQQVLETIPGFVWKTDANGLYTYFNQAWLEFRGRKAEEEIGLGWIEGIHPDDLKWALDAHAEASAKGRPFSRQFRLLGADGQYHWIRDTGRPLSDGNKCVGYCGTATDHTAETLNVQALRDSLDRKETLFKEAHHRIKNNLQILSSLLYLQAQQVTDETVRTILDDCQKRVSVIVLLHQKLFQNELSDELNFAEYVKDLVHAISRSYENERNRIEIDFDIEPVPLHVDKVIAAGLIITELISNSFKHAFPGRPEGRVHLGFHREHADYILEVADEGVGFSGKFDVTGSASLGLRIVTALVTQLRGHYSVQQKGGTRFTIRFPRS